MKIKIEIDPEAENLGQLKALVKDAMISVLQDIEEETKDLGDDLEGFRKMDSNWTYELEF